MKNTIVTTASILALTTLSHATTIAYEGFDYTNSSDLNGQNGGSGFGAGWVDAGNPAPNNFVISTQGLDAGTAAVTGNAATFTGTNGGNYIAYRTLSSSYNTFTGNSQNWFSFQVDYDGSDSSARIGLVEGANPTFFRTNIDYNGSTGTFGVSLGGASQATTNLDLTTGSNLVIVQVTKSYADAQPLTWNIWVNPTDVSSEAALGTVTLTAVNNGANFSYDGIAVNKNFFTGLTVDEFRLANDSFTDLGLTQVPEPSSYALIAGSLALGWIMVRRRK